MPIGQIIKYNKKRKYSIIRPKEWGPELYDVLFETKDFKALIGDVVEYEELLSNGKKYAFNLKKIEKFVGLLYCICYIKYITKTTVFLLDSARKCCFVRTITWLVAVVAAYEHGDMKIRISNVTV